MTDTTPRWTRQPPDVRRRQLLDAAAALIVEKGFNNTAVSEVADRAGVGKGTVYLYFESKTALLGGLQARYWEQMLEVVEAVLDLDASSWTARLDSMVERLVAFGVAEMQLYHALFHDQPAMRGEPTEAFAELIRELLDRGAAAGEFDLVDPGLTAALLVSAVHELGGKVAHLPARRRARAVPALQTLFRRLVGLS